MVGGVAFVHGDGGAVVGSLAGLGIDRNLREERNFESFCFALAST